MKPPPGWLSYIGDEILPSYIGIVIRPYKTPLFTNQYNISSLNAVHLNKASRSLRVYREPCVEEYLWDPGKPPKIAEDMVFLDSRFKTTLEVQRPFC